MKVDVRLVTALENRHFWKKQTSSMSITGKNFKCIESVARKNQVFLLLTSYADWLDYSNQIRYGHYVSMDYLDSIN